MMKKLKVVCVLASFWISTIVHSAKAAVAESCLVEAEAFADKGGWVVDPQFVEQMGSPYLLAHGKGIPVADATTSVNIKPRRVRAYVRTRDWTPDWDGEKPGRFRLSLGGQMFPVMLGVAPATWGWVDAGVVEVGKGPQVLALHDLTGFEGRCDAIYLCPENTDMPPNDASELAAWRTEMRGEAGAPDDVVEADFVVVGGGIAGTAAAVAAAEAGLNVAIVQDRPMLGGNASDEIRVKTEKKKSEYHWIVDAIKNGPANGNSMTADDARRMDFVRGYENINLNTGWRAYGVVTNAARRIVAVDARNVETGARRRFVAPLYCDATGDGWIGYWAGAKYMLGREAKDEYDEQKRAPDVADTSTMGNSLLWTTKKQADDYGFPEVPWATKVSGSLVATKGTWQWEAGLDPAEDTIDDAEMLRDRVFRAIYGSFWNAKQKSENAKLVFNWVPYIAGRRESRRIIGDYVVSEKDVIECRKFEDAIGIATWTIDLHWAKGDSGFLAETTHTRVAPWWMPYRSLCCRDVPNLFLAGRCASYTHVAFGSSRVMHACGQQGVAAGYAASLCKKYGCLPRVIHQDAAKTAELQTLLNQKQAEKGMKPYVWPKPAPALVPMPREIAWAGGTCASAEEPKVKRVAGIPQEGYGLSVKPDGVTIRASDDAGEFYARQTLAQLKDGATFPCCEIKDSPRFKWRGVHVDDVRHFLGKEQVKRTIDQISKYKFNVFHWHLTDDQAWRIAVPGYPMLASNGGFYTADDIREVVAYAAERHIKIVPEVDFPGHFSAVSRAYPAFSCDTGGVRKKGKPPMCVGNPDAVKFVEAALDAVCDLFPGSKIIHIGGDECRRDYWKCCPKCKAMMVREGLAKTQDLQAWLTRHAVNYLAAKGRRAIGWDEMLDAKDGYIPASAMGMRWHEKGAERTARAAADGHEIVNCHKCFCYFDFTQELEGDSHRYFGMGRVSLPLEKVYAFDPLAELPEESRAKVIGGQCNNWTEVTYNGNDLEWKLWPRGFAMAEVLWTYPDPKRRDFADFKRRAAIHRDAMVARGINAAPIN